MNPNENRNVWMTLSEAAEYSRLSQSKIHQIIKSGKLKITRSNGDSGKILIKQNWLDQMLQGESK
ncbi:MAG: helix-turn-helix domain-containing protein [Candidatus Marinimicrobia bacterium]|nr:helix-turn-helix domain-containing protein [Candidatus Neomarinimicrobiota bacterium]